jgi:hypothetical protein
MAKPQEKLAESLEVLHALQARGQAAIRSRDLSRTHRERLVKAGFLKEVIKGWYVPSRPDESPGDSTAWYPSGISGTPAARGSMFFGLRSARSVPLRTLRLRGVR